MQSCIAFGPQRRHRDLKTFCNAVKFHAMSDRVTAAGSTEPSCIHKHLVPFTHLPSPPFLSLSPCHPALSPTGNYSYNLTLMVQEWWEGRQYYDYSTTYCGDDDDDDNRRKREDREEFDDCQSYTQVHTQRLI